MALYRAISLNSPELAIAQLACATTNWQIAANSMPFQGALVAPWSMLVCGSKPCCLWRSSSFTFWFCLPEQYRSNNPDHSGCCPIAAETLVRYCQMRALMKGLGPFNKFKSSTAQLAAIMHGFWIGRPVVAIGWQRQPPWQQQCGQSDHRKGCSNGHYLLFS